MGETERAGFERSVEHKVQADHARDFTGVLRPCEPVTGTPRESVALGEEQAQRLRRVGEVMKGFFRNTVQTMSLESTSADRAGETTKGGRRDVDRREQSSGTSVLRGDRRG